MPSFGSAVRLNKIPVLGLVPESSGTAPTAPAVGQLWTDTSVTPNVVREWDGTAWRPWLIIGTTAGTVADAATVLVRANNLSDLANVATARTNLGLGTAATANTGTGTTDVILGSDARLTDTRTPTDGTVTNAKVATNAAIAESKLALASDAAAGTASRRTIGTGALQAMAGNTRLDQITAPTAAINLNNQRITNLAAPLAGTDAARLSDVQSAAAGIDNKPSVRAATTANITLSGTQTIDGVAVAIGDRVLVKNQTAETENGSYVVAAGAWTRTDDTITANSFWFVEEGTAQADTSWMVTANGTITVGTTPITIGQFGAPGQTSGTANRITVTGGVVDIAANYVGQTSLTTLGTITTGTWNAATVAIAYGGTGATTAAGARANIGASGAGYAATLGALAAGTPFTVTHNLGTQDVIAQVRDASSNEYVYLDVVNASANTVTVTAGQAYAANALRIVVLPV